MKTLAELEQLEKLQHETGLTGAALEEKYIATSTSTAKEVPLHDFSGGPVAEKYIPKR